MSGEDSARSRRTFFTTLPGAAIGALLSSGCAGSTPIAPASRAGLGRTSSSRTRRGYEIRQDVALRHARRAAPITLTNGDDERYPTRFASYSKGLPHDDNGIVDAAAYRALLRAPDSGSAGDYAAIPLAGRLKLSNPRASDTFTLQGADSHQFALPPPPPFASATAAADLAEVYWQAVLRDVPFSLYASHTAVAAACADLARFTGYLGPREAGRITPDLLFRTRGAADGGPYVSQFLYQTVPHAVYQIEQRFRMPVAARDYATTHSEWLALERGAIPAAGLALDTEPRFIRTGRDLARYVHRDYTFQSFLNAALILLRLGEEYQAPNPYLPRACAFGSSAPRLSTEAGFCTFGGPQALDAVAAVAKLALHAAWRQKWLVHRRLRPEEFAQRVHHAINHGADYPIHPDVMDSRLGDVLRHNFFLPMAYPEGSPAHPSYPGGHAAIAGACTTVLKAYFREDARYPASVRPSDDGRSLVPNDDGPLTIRGELEKLAWNISAGRNFAGVHYRSDAVEGINLGEAVAMDYLADVRRCLTEDFAGFTFTTFGGEPVQI